VGDVSAPSDPTAVIARVVLSHPVLDALTGARTTVVLTGYDGDDPWEADDLIALAGEHAKRFGDATPAEQAEASSGGGPCRFVPGDSAGSPYRATMRGHHVHADFDRRRDAAYASRGPAGTTPTPLEIGSGGPEDARYYQTSLCGTVAEDGDPLAWRDATCYAHDGEGRAFDVASAQTRFATPRHPVGRHDGLRARFDLSRSARHGFRAHTARLHLGAAADRCALVLVVSVEVAGAQRFAEITLRRVPVLGIDVRFLGGEPVSLPPAAARP